MKSWIGLLIGMGMVGVVALATVADDKQEKKPGDKPAAKGDEKPAAGGMSEEMMAELMKSMEPNENHKLLDALVGNWKIEVKSMMDPTQPPEVSTGTESSKWIMGGRYVLSEVKGTMMGGPFEGMGITGYDNILKKYVNTWIDSAGTGILYTTGTYDAATKSYTYRGDYAMPGGVTMKIRMVIKVIDKDKHVFEWHQAEPDGEKKTMEIVYTRAAG